jgi:hypothetical protein
MDDETSLLFLDGEEHRRDRHVMIAIMRSRTSA